MKPKFVFLAMLLASATPCLAGKYELDDPSGRQFLPDSVNNAIDRVDRFKERLDQMGESASNAYGNAKERLNSLMDTSTGSDNGAGYSTSSKRALQGMGSGSPAQDSAASARSTIIAKEYQLNQQRNRCVTMRTGSRTQAECDLKAMCMEDDLKRAKTGYSMPTETPVMATGQCNGPNPSAAALAQLQSGNAALMGMLDGNGAPGGAASPLEGLMQQQQQQEVAAAEARRQAEVQRQAEAQRQAEMQRQAEARRQAELQRQQQVAAAQAQAEAASSDDGMLDMAMGLLGAAASVYGAQRAARPTGSTYTAPSGSGAGRVHCIESMHLVNEGGREFCRGNNAR